MIRSRVAESEAKTFSSILSVSYLCFYFFVNNRTKGVVNTAKLGSAGGQGHGGGQGGGGSYTEHFERMQKLQGDRV